MPEKVAVGPLGWRRWRQFGGGKADHYSFGSKLGKGGREKIGLTGALPAGAGLLEVGDGDEGDGWRLGRGEGRKERRVKKTLISIYMVLQQLQFCLSAFEFLVHNSLACVICTVTPYNKISCNLAHKMLCFLQENSPSDLKISSFMSVQF